MDRREKTEKEFIILLFYLFQVFKLFYLFQVSAQTVADRVNSKNGRTAMYSTPSKLDGIEVNFGRKGKAGKRIYSFTVSGVSTVISDSGVSTVSG